MAIEPKDVDSNERRRLFKTIIAISAGSIAAITLVPSVRFLIDAGLATARRQRRKVIFANPADAKSATFVPARYEGLDESAPGIFVRFDGDKPVVLSAKCTHAG